MSTTTCHKKNRKRQVSGCYSSMLPLSPTQPQAPIVQCMILCCNIVNGVLHWLTNNTGRNNHRAVLYLHVLVQLLHYLYLVIVLCTTNTAHCPSNQANGKCFSSIQISAYLTSVLCVQHMNVDLATLLQPKSYALSLVYILDRSH